MGEYIEPSATAWGNAELANPSDDGWSDSVALPQLAGASCKQVLVLSWVLLLSRGTVSSEDGGFSWSGGSEIHGGLLTDVIENQSNLLRDVLERLRALGRIDEEMPDTLLFKNGSPGSEVSKTCHVIRISG